jgi:hypothetical protein
LLFAPLDIKFGLAVQRCGPRCELFTVLIEVNLAYRAAAGFADLVAGDTDYICREGDTLLRLVSSALKTQVSGDERVLHNIFVCFARIVSRSNEPVQYHLTCVCLPLCPGPLPVLPVGVIGWCHAPD